MPKEYAYILFKDSSTLAMYGEVRTFIRARFLGAKINMRKITVIGMDNA